MLKVTLKFKLIYVIFLLLGCRQEDSFERDLERLGVEDDRTESRIDSAYSAIMDSCGQRGLRLSLLGKDELKDSVSTMGFFDTGIYRDPNPKVQAVVRRLRADCDSVLRNAIKKASRKAAKGAR